MSRQRYYRQYIQSQIESITVKSLHHFILSQNISRYGMAPDEAEILAEKAYHYFQQHLLTLSENKICIELPEISGNFKKGSLASSLHKCIEITVFHKNDLSILQEFGLKAIQNARICRILEEVFLQGCQIEIDTLAKIVNITPKSIRQRLRPLWESNITLPLALQSKKWRIHLLFRSTYALKSFFHGESISEIRSKLFLSAQDWQKITMDFATVALALREEKPLFKAVSQLSIDLYEQYQSLVTNFNDSIQFQKLLDLHQHSTLKITKPSTAKDSLFTELTQMHLFSPAAAISYLEMLEQLSVKINRLNRAAGTIIYYAISQEEPPSKGLAHCDLIPLILTYWSQDDLNPQDPYQTSERKWNKFLRLSIEAREQGGLLTQFDLAFLLGVTPKVIQRLMKLHPEQVIPTRGNIQDIGPGITHAEKICKLYLQGFTETEIKLKTGHSYHSIEHYLIMFSKIVGLVDQGLPLPLVRRAIGCSMNLAQKFYALYQAYNLPEYQWSLAQIRRSFLRPESEKKQIHRGIYV